MTDPLDDPGLFVMDPAPPVTLADKFHWPPFSILDRRQARWQDRRRRWLALGIQSEIGRTDRLIRGGRAGHAVPDPGTVRAAHLDYNGGTSIFDPVLTELAYRWFSRPGDRVLDPFAGGSVRGIVASTLARWYTGIDLRPEQVTANEAQHHLGSDIRPQWIIGDGTQTDTLLDPAATYDLVFSCPPYADLEVYSDDPADLSTMTYDEYTTAHTKAITDACHRLEPDRFAVWVISDVRDWQGTYAYRGLVADTIHTFRDVGMELHNDLIVIDPIGTSAMRAERPFVTTRKVTRVHQHMLVFIKGDARAATARLTHGQEETPTMRPLNDSETADYLGRYIGFPGAAETDCGVQVPT